MARATELIHRIRRADKRLAVGAITPFFRDTPTGTPSAYPIGRIERV
jgi:hypothetical protein